jgi:hypothetical protein
MLTRKVLEKGGGSRSRIHERSGLVRTGLLALVVALGLMGVACAGQQRGAVATASDAGPDHKDLPSWIVSVYPGPGRSMASVSVVEVVHRVSGPRRGVRLLVDGVDVTATSKLSSGRLQYNPRRRALAPLDSGFTSSS